MGVIALLTDFSTRDGYVGAMKGKILSYSLKHTIVDITHDVPPFDVRSGAFALLNSYRTFPSRTVFVVVVDPGVGTPRAGLVVESRDYLFIGPDNGVFSLILKEEEPTLWQIRTEMLPWEVSSTFHGRDVFAPLGAMAAVSRAAIEPYLEPFDANPQTFWKDPRWEDGHHLQGEVLHIDRFGNIILNIKQEDIPPEKYQTVRVMIGKHEVKGMKKTFGEVPPGELLINFDSSGFLQIARNQGNAAQKLKCKTGDRVIVFL